MDVPALGSTQKKSDRRIILHTLYSTHNDGIERVIIHAKYTDVITMCTHYGATYTFF